MPLSICQSKMKGNSKHFSLSLLGAGQKKDICAVCRRYLPRLNYVSNLCYKILLCNCNEIVKKAMALVGKTSTLPLNMIFAWLSLWHAHLTKESKLTFRVTFSLPSRLWKLKSLISILHQPTIYWSEPTPPPPYAPPLTHFGSYSNFLAWVSCE